VPEPGSPRDDRPGTHPSANSLGPTATHLPDNGYESAIGRAILSINASDFVDSSAYPPSFGPSSIPASEQLKVFGSYHPNGCHMAFADGSVAFLEQSVDITLYRRLATRADGNSGAY